MLHVFCHDCPDLTCVSGDDDSGDDVTSSLAFCTQEGVAYHIFVSGFGTERGNYQLTVTDSGSACTSQINCLPTGACYSCLEPPVNCSIQTEELCRTQGSRYQGNDTECYLPTSHVSSFTSQPNLSIPEADAVGVTDVITIGESFTIGDLDVNVVIDHTAISDLKVTLTGPNGAVIDLWNRVCGAPDNLNVTFDDEGAPLLCAEPTVGTYRPVSANGQALAAFDGKDTAGDWTLRVSDNQDLDLGTLLRWTRTATKGKSICDQRRRRRLPPD